MDFSKELSIRPTNIPGLLVLDLPVHGDSRGWFKENWQREKMLSLGLPDFRPVQNNVSFNERVGTTRGIHAEPWDKYVSVASGEIFAAWVDLRQGSGFGQVFSLEMDESKAVFVPRGVGNSFQTLAPLTVYSYLVNDHWSEKAEYVFLNLADESVRIPWPIPLAESEISEKDKHHPLLVDVKPMKPNRTLVLGESGQLARALRVELPNAEFLNREAVDFSSDLAFENIDFTSIDVLVNTVAYTRVDDAESDEGRALAWRINAHAVAVLAGKCEQHGVTLVHISSDYVFDGHGLGFYTERDLANPLGVYGQSKAAGDLAAQVAKKHYIVRTSWVIGDGPNFVRTMAKLAKSDVNPEVVNDQIGQVTFATDIAKAIRHLIDVRPDYGIYNVTNSGSPTSWFEVAKSVFVALGEDSSRVKPVTTSDFFKGKVHAPRPLNSALEITKIIETGFTPRTAKIAFDDYIASNFYPRES